MLKQPVQPRQALEGSNQRRSFRNPTVALTQVIVAFSLLFVALTSYFVVLI
ncbi:hypothetical protein ACQKM9_19255 [Viridibacillus sp. NPDC093762]|uniref:hypothetical protein n=1 Tax=Viridibacillus sp. NPDC093762 TaxID=3390720 RepID=UPI003CFE09C0